MANKKKWLYGAAVQGIQGFIFQTDKLKDIVGASELVEQACTCVFNEITGTVEGESKAGVEPVVQAAGNVKCIFSDEDILKRVVLSYPKHVMEKAPGITVSQAVVEMENENYKDASDELEKRLRAQRNKQAKSLVSGLMAMARSPRTGLPAVECKQGDLTDEGCRAKQGIVDGKARYSLYEKLYGGKGEVTPRQVYENCDISSMTQKNDWIAIIHADGNGLGEVVAKKGKSPDEMSRFSRKLDEATRLSAQSACKEVNGKGEDGHLWIRPVVIGGDDLTVICRADLAIPFVRHYLKAFEENSKSHIGDSLSACAGIAFIKSSYPFYYGYSLAETLCGVAKKDAKSDEMKNANGGKIPSCLMFHKVQSSFVEDYETIKRKELAPASDCSFCFGPYYLTGQAGRWTIQRLCEKAGELAKEENNPVKTAAREWMTLMFEDKGVAEQKAKRVEQIYSDDKRELFSDVTGMVARVGQEPKFSPAYDVLSLLTINNQETK